VFAQVRDTRTFSSCTFASEVKVVVFSATYSINISLFFVVISDNLNGKIAYLYGISKLGIIINYHMMENKMLALFNHH